MSGKRLQLAMDGPGGARIDGSVAQVSARISGSGSLEGRRLAAASTDIEVRGPGSASVNVAGNGGAASGHGQVLLVDRSGSRHVAD
jgi:hypothetical protein